MASAIAVATLAVQALQEEELTDEKIQILLAQAAERLQEKASSQLVGEDEAKRYTFPKLSTGELARPCVSTKGDVARVENSVALQEKDRKLSNQIRKVEDPVAVRNRQAESKKATAGDQWYNLPKTDLTPELKRDLQLLKMRNVLDPHRHYKKDNGKMMAPEYSQVGTVREGATEFFSARLQNKDRKRTFVEEVLGREQQTGRFKNKYGDVQAAKTSGKKAFYKSLQAQRKSGVKKR